MPFYRFENMEQIVTNPHLSTGKGAVVDGQYITLRNNNKDTGTGSQLHYHPNELLIFTIAGKLNAVVGKEHHIVSPGTFIHVPPNARHSMKATEEGPVSYLYCKDNTWTMTGIAADEAPPDKAPTVEEIKKEFESGKWPGKDKAPEESQAIVEGLDECFYHVMDFAEPANSGRMCSKFEGERLSFTYYDSPKGFHEGEDSAKHERFIYVMSGKVEASLDGESKKAESGDLLHILKGNKYSFEVKSDYARYVIFEASTFLETKIDA